MRLRRLWDGNGKRDVEVQPNRGMALSHESYGVAVSDDTLYILTGEGTLNKLSQTKKRSHLQGCHSVTQ